jgi:hypothetical protein
MYINLYFQELFIVCQQPQVDDRAFLTSVTAYVFSVFFYDTDFYEGYIAYETLVSW